MSGSANFNFIMTENDNMTQRRSPQNVLAVHRKTTIDVMPTPDLRCRCRHLTEAQIMSSEFTESVTSECVYQIYGSKLYTHFQKLSTKMRSTIAELSNHHSSCRVVSSSRRVAGGRKRGDTARPRAFQRFSMGLRSSEYAGHAIRAMPSLSALWGRALPSI
ncbi:hypothetical protein TNCV_2550991 [Trichonephila clavipes]|nr:hypothetical protein TNCV_2550991 [Trichonephila clavipes]